MLVIDGRIHPKILPTGTSEKIRNGVCVRDGDDVDLRHLRASRSRSTPSPGCSAMGSAAPTRLFLDGSVSSLYAPELGRDDELTPLGPMIGVSAPASP